MPISRICSLQLGLAAIPYIAYFLCINFAAIFADFLLSKRILSTVNTRRLMMVIGEYGTRFTFTRQNFDMS